MDAEVSARLDTLLQYSDDRCRKLVELAEEGVWLLDRNEQTLWVNPEMATMLGCTTEQMQGAPFCDFQPLPLPGHRRQQLPPLSVTRQQCEIRMHHRGGIELWLSAVIHPILDAKGAASGRVSSCQQHHGSQDVPSAPCARASAAITTCLPTRRWASIAPRRMV